MKNKVLIFIKSILIPVIVGGVVGLIISKFIDYNSLQKPFLSPPGFLFPIVWTVLYVLMGIFYGILESKNKIDDNINLVYYLQLGINAIWSILFFVAKWRFFSFIWIILLLVIIVIMIIKFYSKNKIAAYLQIPYLLWTLFATYLNLGVFLLNR